MKKPTVKVLLPCLCPELPNIFPKVEYYTRESLKLMLKKAPRPKSEKSVALRFNMRCDETGDHFRINGEKVSWQEFHMRRETECSHPHGFLGQCVDCNLVVRGKPVRW